MSQCIASEASIWAMWTPCVGTDERFSILDLDILLCSSSRVALDAMGLVTMRFSLGTLPGKNLSLLPTVAVCMSPVSSINCLYRPCLHSTHSSSSLIRSRRSRNKMASATFKTGLILLAQLKLTQGMVILPRSSVSCDYQTAAASGDTCTSFAAEWGLTEETFASINPGITCPNLVSGQDYCVVGTVTSTGPTTTASSTVTTSAVTSSTSSSTSSSSSSLAPYQPQQSGTAATCDQYHLVGDGDSCSAIESQYDISLTEFLAWNPSLNSGKSNSPSWVLHVSSQAQKRKLRDKALTLTGAALQIVPTSWSDTTIVSISQAPPRSLLLPPRSQSQPPPPTASLPPAPFRLVSPRLATSSTSSNLAIPALSSPTNTTSPSPASTTGTQPSALRVPTLMWATTSVWTSLATPPRPQPQPPLLVTESLPLIPSSPGWWTTAPPSTLSARVTLARALLGAMA